MIKRNTISQNPSVLPEYHDLEFLKNYNSDANKCKMVLKGNSNRARGF